MKIRLLIGCIAFASSALAQSIPTINKSRVAKLASEEFWGRGYTKNGLRKAADYLVEELKTAGVKPLKGDDYFQSFTHPVNTFPGTMKLSVNDKPLQPGLDYLIGPDSKSAKASGSLKKIDSVHYVDAVNEVVFTLEKKLTWSVSPKQELLSFVTLNSTNFPEEPKTYQFKAEAKLIEEFEAQNICGMVKGTAVPDSFIFFTAHYDHLGGMGDKIFFPGANDNASGVALLLSLADYFAQHPQRYSIGFILFAGEEIGLLGSRYYVNHPLTPLKKIKFLINTDLAGTGDDGITVVNATEFPAAFELMKSINREENYVKDIAARGKAANSDHYFFTEKGVPSFFFYTRGGIAAYHDINDKAETLPLNEQEDLKALLIKFTERMQ